MPELAEKFHGGSALPRLRLPSVVRLPSSVSTPGAEDSTMQ